MQYYYLYSRNSVRCFSSDFWNRNASWTIEMDWERRVQMGFADLRLCCPKCGTKYYPFKKGAGAQFEVMVGKDQGTDRATKPGVSLQRMRKLQLEVYPPDGLQIPRDDLERFAFPSSTSSIFKDWMEEQRTKAWVMRWESQRRVSRALNDSDIHGRDESDSEV